MELQSIRSCIVGTRRSDPAVRLFCLPFAGGGATEYTRWQDAFDNHIEVCPVELPGRQTRWREAPERNIEPLVDGLAAAIADELDRPYALFGHSMGGLVAFELARALRRRGRAEPAVLFVSASRAPQISRELHRISDAATSEVLARLKSLGGLPDELQTEPELLEVLLPTLRADFSVCEQYKYVSESPLSCPIVAFAGADDRDTTPAMMAPWREQTVAFYAPCLLPGGHFFLRSERDTLLGHIQNALAQCLQPRDVRGGS